MFFEWTVIQVAPEPGLACFAVGEFWVSEGRQPQIHPQRLPCVCQATGGEPGMGGGTN